MTPTLAKAIQLATSKLGLKELTGNNDGPEIDEMLKLCGLDNQAEIKRTGKGYAWCASFVSWVLYNATGGQIKPNAWAPTWVLDKKRLVTDGKYRCMDVATINRPNVAHGHVFFILADQSDTVLTIEGNWGGQCCVNERPKTELSAVARYL
jgi:uncharacterized protein (TIGR02594 family)